MKTFILIFVLLVTTCLYSTIINVPTDQPTIQAGIVAATDTDTVLVEDGTYFENIDFIGKAITVASNYIIDADTLHIENTIINGSQPSNPDFGSVITFMSDEDATSIITGFTLTEGTGYFNPSVNCTFGGGIYCSSSSPSLENLIITDNNAYSGGGISCSNTSNPSLMNVTIISNSATYGGGILCIYNSNLSMDNVAVNQNTAGSSGGGIYIEYSNLQFENCDFTDNSAQEYHGGALYYWNYGDPMYAGIEYQIEFINCNFSNNAALVKFGGVGIGQAADDLAIMNVDINNCEFANNIADNYCGLRLSGNSLTFSVLNCIFSENEAISYAAGGGFSGNCTGEIMNCLIVDNTAATGGGDWNSGGFSVWSEASVDFVNCTFVDNSAAFGAGLTVGGGGEATITNCLLWGNSFDQIGFGEWNNAGGSLTVNNCDVQYGIDSIYVTPFSNLDWGNGNIDDDPLFVGTGDHPFMLQDLSPCVNVGISDTTGLNLPEFDLAGNSRVYGGRIDMGAYENQNVVGVNEDLIPLVTKLNQNYPNPFNPTTTINYSLKENSKISLNIYNIKGQKVKQLINDQVSVGQHSVVWNGTDDNYKSVSSGIYFYKLKSTNFEKTRKMILIK